MTTTGSHGGDALDAARRVHGGPGRHLVAGHGPVQHGGSGMTLALILILWSAPSRPAGALKRVWMGATARQLPSPPGDTCPTVDVAVALVGDGAPGGGLFQAARQLTSK